MDNKCIDILIKKLNKLNNYTKNMILNDKIDYELLYNSSIQTKLKMLFRYLDSIDQKQLNKEFQEILVKCGKK